MLIKPDAKKIAKIKLVGVGGGGSNAVNHMYRLGIKDVDFVVCNTDAQALANSPVPIKIQLGSSLTEGRGFITMEFDHYEEVPRHIAEQIISGHK